MEMNLFIGAVIDMPNSKISRIIKKFCEPFIGAEFVIHSNLYEDSYKTSYEKITDSKTIKHVIHLNCDDSGFVAMEEMPERRPALHDRPSDPLFSGSL